jgi:hypothetical protein
MAKAPPWKTLQAYISDSGRIVLIGRNTEIKLVSAMNTSLS